MLYCWISKNPHISNRLDAAPLYYLSSTPAIDHLPTSSQLQHVQELNETQQHLDLTELTHPTIPTSYPNKSSPPVLISSGLPPVPAKLVKRIQQGSFVEMVELLPETLSSPEYAPDNEPAGQKQKRREVTNIINWVQCFGVFIAIVCRKEPSRISDLIGYQNLIIQASIHCQAGRWVDYDRRFRLKASAAIIPEWSTIDITIWNLAFPDCLQGGTPYEASGKATYKPSKHSLGPTPTRTRPICLE